MKGLLFLFTFLIGSCSLFSPPKKGIVAYGPYREVTINDFIEHLTSLRDSFLNSTREKILPLDYRSSKYLQKIHKRIFINNELLLKNKYRPKFYIVQDSWPFYFSLPKGHFFFSSGLFSKYFKSEEYLIAVLTGEMIKSHCNIYPQKMVVPLGHIQTEKLLHLIRLPLSSKVEINKLTYFAMKRAGGDPSAILHWIQTQNKNFLDFHLQHGGLQKISEEELQFKQFIIGHAPKINRDTEYGQNSSKDFYHLLNYVKINT